MPFLSRRPLLICLFLLPLLLGIWAWRAASWRPKIARVSTSPILALVWASDGKTLTCVSQDGNYRVLSVSTLGGAVRSRMPGDWRAAQFSEKGDILTLAGEGGVERWSSAPPKRLWSRPYSNEGADALSTTDAAALGLSSSGESWAIAETYGNHGAVLTWVSKPGGRVIEGKSPYYDVAEALALSADGKLLAYGGETPGIAVWSKKAGKCLWTGIATTAVIHPRMAAATALCFSPNGQRLAASFLSGETILLNSQTGTVVRTFDGTAPGQCLVFSPDAHLLAGGGNKGEVEVWDVATGHSLIDASSGTSHVRALAFSPDGTRLAVGTSKGQVQLWRVR